MTAPESPEELAALDMFDHVRNRPGEPFDDVDVLTGIDHDGFAGAVLDRMEAEAPTDPDVVRAVVRLVTDLAPHLALDASAFLVGASNLILAQTEAVAGDWGQALERLDAAETADPDLEDMVGALRHRVLGAQAEGNGDLDAAAEHCARAASMYAESEVWGFAAEAATQAAGVAERRGDVEGALSWWSRAASDLQWIGAADLAVDYAQQGAILALRTLQDLPQGATRRGLDLALQGRALAVEHRIARAAGELSCAVGIFGADAGWAWTECVAGFDDAHGWYRQLTDVSDAERELVAAWVDFSAGNAATVRARPADAEPLLRRALDTYERHGHTAEAGNCVRLLTGIVGFALPSTDVAGAMTYPTIEQDPEHRGAVLVSRALTEHRAGRHREAADLLADARSLAVEAGSPVKAAMADMIDALHGLQRGDLDSARQRLAEVDRFVATEPDAPLALRHGLDTLRTMLRAALAEREGDRSAMPAAVDALEADALARGAGVMAAFAASCRAEYLLRDGRPREALDAALPAVLALDAYRFTLDDADRRRRWSAVVAGTAATAFRAAAACGAITEIAELIETLRGNGAPIPSTEESGIFEKLLDDAGQRLAAEPPEAKIGNLAPLTGAFAVTADARRTLIGVPPRLRTPWGTVALGAALERAERYHRPVRSGGICAWVIE